eukprot:923346-Prymnesium_polylepis.1
MLGRLTRARPWLAPRTPELRGADLGSALGRRAVRHAAACGPSGSTTVFVCEALLMYLPERQARRLLRTCARAGGWLIFADRLPGGVDDREEAEAMLRSAGLTLDTWTINSAALGSAAVVYGPRGASPNNGDARALVAAGARVSSARHLGVAHGRRRSKLGL